MGASRERRHDRNLETILAAARGIVAETGPDALSVREVARRADYSPAALYRYFRGMDEIVAALGSEAVAILGRYVEEVPPTLPPRERLVALGEAYTRFADECPEQFALIERLRVPAQEWTRYVEVAYPFTLVVAAFAEAAESGAIVSPDPAADALGLWALAHGFAALRAGHLHYVAIDLAPARRSAFAAYVGGLEKGGAR